MILADVNLLIYAYDGHAVQHVAAKEWVEQAMAGPEPFALSWFTIHGFIRITTNLRAFPRPIDIGKARATVADWLQCPNVCLINPGDRHWDILGSLLKDGGVRGPLVSDAVLAAIAIEHGAVLHSTDRDFLRFPGLKWRNPLDG